MISVSHCTCGDPLYCIGMVGQQRLETFLETLAREAKPGDRLPTVRQLMTEFGVSQQIVQRATEQLRIQGRITAATRRGTFFVGDERAAPAKATQRSDQRTVLFLRRSTSLQRGRRVLELLQSRLQAEGCRVVEVSYTDGRDALQILRTLPRFDACVLQSTFETISIEMLAAARQKSPVLVVDGAVLAETEVDAVGIEWGSAVNLALEHLWSQGHERIGLVISSHFALATELGRIWYQARIAPQKAQVIQIPSWPQEDYAAKAAEMIAAQRDAGGKLPFSALIVWGIEDGADYAACMARQGIDIPSELSVVMLGRTDLANEHANFFTSCGTTTTLLAKTLHETIAQRWQEPDREYRVHYLPMRLSEAKSVLPYVQVPQA
jgi:DNA-binding LacI/PurR family transcriptional regulator